MNYSTIKLSILSISIFFTGNLLATQPNVPTDPPYIVLNENLDESNGFGFCLDTYGPGRSELMHTHSCKPKTSKGSARDNPAHDVRFEYNSATKRISSYAYQGKCMQVLIAKGKSEFALLECSNHPHQKFVYQQTDKTLRLDKDQSYCVAVDSISQLAGPWVKRALQLVKCNKVESALKQWLVVSR